MQGAECDTCRKFAPSLDGWFILARISTPAHHGIVAMLTGGQSRDDEPLTFCCLLCVTNYAYVKAMTEGHGAPGSEP